MRKMLLNCALHSSQSECVYDKKFRKITEIIKPTGKNPENGQFIKNIPKLQKLSNLKLNVFDLIEEGVSEHMFLSSTL